MGWSSRTSRGHQSNLLSKQDQIRLLGTVSTWVLKTSKDGDYTTLLGNLFLGFYFNFIYSLTLTSLALGALPLIPYHALL